MSPHTMTLPQTSPQQTPTRTAHEPDLSTRELIDAARAQPAPMRGALAAVGLTSLLTWASFTPLNFSPLGWICLVPFLLLARIERPTRRMYLAVYLGGLAYWLPTLQWMRLGDATMYTAWFAMSLYVAFYFPVCLGLTRLAVHRFRVPLTICFPVIWVGLEFARAYIMTGFSWYYLGHTQYRWLELIQISDVVGAYGVSFVVALMSAALALLVPPRWIAKLQLLPPNEAWPVPRQMPTIGFRGVIICAAIFCAVVGYGYWRRSAANFNGYPAPRIAAIQTNVPTRVKHDSQQAESIYRSLHMMTGAIVPQQPDLIVWPETMVRFPLFEASLDVSDEELHKHIPPNVLTSLRSPHNVQQLSNLAKMSNAALVVGIEALSADRNGVRTYNSAAFFSPKKGYAGRYDKMHRVPFGEYLPMGDSMPWLSVFSPYPADFGIDPGNTPHAFEHQGVRYAPMICFEDSVPHVVREVARTPGGQGVTGKPVDVLLNLTNDGWFDGSSELDQHLITAAFRCVELRTPMVRSVNTGISAVIDGDGAIRARAIDPQTKQSKQVEALLVEDVPLDNRRSLYLAGGDWFAGSCLSACGLLVVAGLLGRWIPKRSDPGHNAV